MINQQLQAYIEREIIPRYDAFDAAHRRDHVATVIETGTGTFESVIYIVPSVVVTVATRSSVHLADALESVILDRVTVCWSFA